MAKRTIRIPLTKRGVANAMKELEAEKKRILRAQQAIVETLLEMGADSIRTTLTGHVYSGQTIGSVNVELATQGTVVRGVLSVGGQAILFLEFGAGLIGYGHPRASEFGFGPGSYEGEGKWDNPNGWWYPTDDPLLAIRRDKYGQGWGFSRGTRPIMPMQQAVELIERNILRVARGELGA